MFGPCCRGINGMLDNWNQSCGFDLHMGITTRIWGPVKSTPKMTATEAINGRISTCIFPLRAAALALKHVLHTTILHPPSIVLVTVLRRQSSARTRSVQFTTISDADNGLLSSQIQLPRIQADCLCAL